VLHIHSPAHKAHLPVQRQRPGPGDQYRPLGPVSDQDEDGPGLAPGDQRRRFQQRVQALDGNQAAHGAHQGNVRADAQLRPEEPAGKVRPDQASQIQPQGDDRHLLGRNHAVADQLVFDRGADSDDAIHPSGHSPLQGDQQAGQAPPVVSAE